MNDKIKKFKSGIGFIKNIDTYLDKEDESTKECLNETVRRFMDIVLDDITIALDKTDITIVEKVLTEIKASEDYSQINTKKFIDMIELKLKELKKGEWYIHEK